MDRLAGGNVVPTGNPPMIPANRRPLIVLAICAVCRLTFVVLWSRGFLPLQQAENFA